MCYCCTLYENIGLTNNKNSLVVAGRSKTFYCKNIGIFDLSIAGVPNAIFGIAYILLFAPLLLPDLKEYERRKRLALLSPSDRAAAKKVKRSWIGALFSKIFGRKGSDQEELIEIHDVVGEDDDDLKKGNKEEAGALIDASASANNPEFSTAESQTTNGAKSSSAIPLSLAKEAAGFILNAIVQNDSPVTNKTVSEAGLRGEDGLYLISVQRGNTLYSAVGRNFGIEPGDLLSFTGRAENFVPFAARKGLQPITVDSHDTGLSAPNPVTTSSVQAIVRDGSDLIGKTPKEADFRRKYNAAILSIWRAGQRLTVQKMGQVQLKVGDTLLLVTNEHYDWNNADTSRDLKPRRDAEQQRLISAQDSQRDFLLDEQQSDLIVERTFYISMKVLPSSKLGGNIGSIAGKTIEITGLRAIPGIVLFAIQRIVDGQLVTYRAVGPDFVVEGGDILWYSGEREGVNALRRLPGLVDPDQKQLEKLRIAAHERRLVEVVLSLRSDMLYKSVRESRFRSRFNAAIVAIHRQGAPVMTTIGDVYLQPGDVLILDAGPTFVANNRDDPNFLLVTELDASAPPQFEKFYIAFITSIAMIALAAGLESEGINLVLLACWASAIMLAAQCLTGDRAMQSLDWGVIITVACAFGISRALEKTLVAPIFGNGFVSLALLTNTGELGILTTVMAATALLSSLVANNAAALLMFPIAAQAAAGLGVSPNKMLYALMFGASDYATPFGYQTNLMVMAPGGYIFSDYAKFGGPLMLYLLIFQVIILALLENWYIMWFVSLAFLGLCIVFDVTFRGGGGVKLPCFRKEQAAKTVESGDE